MGGSGAEGHRKRHGGAAVLSITRRGKVKRAI